MMNYKIKLQANELQATEYISFNEKTQLTIQSIYSYLVKHTSLNGGSFTKSLTRLHKMYLRYHNKISYNWFKKIIKKLVDFNMVIIDKTFNVNTYMVNRNVNINSNITNNVTNNVTNEKISESIDITSLQENFEKPKSNYKLNNNITIIDNTVSKTVIDNNFKKFSAYEKACKENNKDLVEPKELIELAMSKLKEQRRHSKKIIARLKSKLENRTNVVRKNMDKYLDVVIADCIAFYEVERKNMSLLIAKRKNKLSNSYNTKKNTRANFTQRKYDYDKLEKQLLGWDDDDIEIGTIEPTKAPTTANFTQRIYDYDKLEKQLLGWDDDEDED